MHLCADRIRFRCFMYTVSIKRVDTNQVVETIEQETREAAFITESRLLAAYDEPAYTSEIKKVK